MYETIINEVATKAKEFSFDDINKKLSPMELIKNSEKFGLSGDKNELKEIINSTRSDFVRTEVNKEIEDIKINDKSKYSSDVNEYIATEEELEIYQTEGLEEGQVNDRLTLKDTKIDPDLKDSKGRTNLERMENGRAPYDENGRPYNLHHIGQKSDSPLAELKDSTHKKNDSILHDKSNPTEVHNSDSGVNWDRERSQHWQERAKEIKAERD